MRPPLPPAQLLAFILILFILLFVLQLGIFSLVLEKLGLSAHSAMLLLFVTLFGSGINLPVTRLKIPPGTEPAENPFIRWLPVKYPSPDGYTVIAINVGGALVPVLFSLYLVQVTAIPVHTLIISTTIVSAVCYFMSRPVKGLGIGMPVFIAPLAAAIVAMLLAPQHSAPLAYICGTMGVLIGADLLRIRDIPRLGVAIASIGGAGTFDGIFITGIVAVLLA